MADVNFLRSIGKVEQFTKGQLVFMENDAGANMYLVLKGVFGIYLNSFIDFPVKVADIQQGSFFGEMSVIDNWPRSATVIADDESMALVIEKDNFAKLLENSPEHKAKIIETLYKRAESTAATVREAGKDAPEIPKAETVDENDMTGSIELMKNLAQLVRYMNLLLTNNDSEKTDAEPAAAPPKETAQSAPKLLPEPFLPLNEIDENDNTRVLQAKEVTCPFCHTEMTAYFPNPSRLQAADTTLDGRVFYLNFNPLLFTNIVCPFCYFTDTYQEFTKYKKYQPQDVYQKDYFINQEGFTGYQDEYKHTYKEAFLSYYQNIRCLTSLQSPAKNPLPYAKTWLKLHWLHTDTKMDNLALGAAMKACDFYASFLDKGDFNTLDEMRLNAILGELSVTLDDKKSAMQYFRNNTVLARKMSGAAAQELEAASVKRYNEIK